MHEKDYELRRNSCRKFTIDQYLQSETDPNHIIKAGGARSECARGIHAQYNEASGAMAYRTSSL